VLGSGCSLRSLDYLQAGSNTDGGGGTAGAGVPDGAAIGDAMDLMPADHPGTGGSAAGGSLGGAAGAGGRAAGGGGGGRGEGGARDGGGGAGGGGGSVPTGSGGGAGIPDASADDGKADVSAGTGGASTPDAGANGGTGAPAGGAGGGGNGSGGAGGAGGAITGSGGSAPAVLFVVGSTNLSSDDTKLSDRLKGLGFQVRPTRDSDANASLTATVAAVVISRSAGSANIGTRLRDVTKGLLTCESGMYKDMAMVDPNTSTSWGYTDDLTQVTVQANAGPLGAGRSGTVVVQSAADSFSFGIPSAEGIQVAAEAGQTPAKWAIFAYEAGAQMYGRKAPARRVGFYFSRTSPSRATADAWALFDAAVKWISGM